MAVLLLALFKPIFCAFASEIVSFLGVYVLLILPLTLAKLLTALLLQLAFCLFSARMCIVSCLVVDVLLHLAWFAPLFCAFASCIFFSVWMCSCCWHAGFTLDWNNFRLAHTISICINILCYQLCRVGAERCDKMRWMEHNWPIRCRYTLLSHTSLICFCKTRSRWKV